MLSEYILYPGMLLCLWLVFKLVILPVQFSLAEIRELVESRADRDRVTGLWNRNGLWEALELALEKPSELPISIIFIDIDRFKNIMRDFGEHAADVVAADVGYCLLQETTRRDFVCRYDREQFVLLLLNIDGPSAQQRAEVVRERISQIRDSDFPELKITASLGVCDIRGIPERTPKAILEAVQEATYMAKKAGRNRVFRGDAFLRRLPASSRFKI